MIKKIRNTWYTELASRILFVSIALIALTLLAPISTVSAQTQPLNDTGITKCGDYAYGGSENHNNDVDCSLTVDADGDPVPPGQDGHYGRDVTHNDDADGHAGFSFTKIDSNGDPLPASATSWDCVLDNVTGLTWEVKTDDGGLRDKNWGYTWYNSNPDTNGGNAGTQNGGNCYDSVNCDTEKFTTQVNATGLCGHNDWRVPGLKELWSIVDHSVLYPGPTIDETVFPNALGTAIASATTFALNPGIAMNWRFDHGGPGSYFKAFFPIQEGTTGVRLVRGGQPGAGSPIDAIGSQICKSDIPATTPNSRFAIHDDGTLTDNETGLIWKQCVEGLSGVDCTTGSASTMNWKVALEHAATQNDVNHEDWRIPNIKELGSIVEFSCHDPAVNLSIFPNTPAAITWSSSPHVGAGSGWNLTFLDGVLNLGTVPNDKSQPQVVRLVRDAEMVSSGADLGVSIQSERTIFRPNKDNRFTIAVTNHGNADVSDAEVTIQHNKGYKQGFFQNWRCLISSTPDGWKYHRCKKLSQQIDSAGDTIAKFQVSVDAGYTVFLEGFGEFSSDANSVSITATLSGGTPDDTNTLNDSIARTISTFPPDSLPGNRETKLCNSPDHCDDNSTLVIDTTKPTIVLTHGLQPGDCERNELWTAFRITPPGAALLLVSELSASDINVLQYFWKGACHGEATPTRSSYIAARENVYHAGEMLARKLKNLLGVDYVQKIQFIGHSLGTAVNAYASRIFLEAVTGIPEAQMTILDYPNKVGKIGLLLFNEMTTHDERVYGFDSSFFAEVLPFELMGNKLKVDNYYTHTTSLSTKFSSHGVGSKIEAPQQVLNRSLGDPHEVGDSLLPSEAAFFNIIDNDHSGPHQWYRWTVRPKEDKNFYGNSVCTVTGWNGEPFILSHSTLNPCLNGWHQSIMQAPYGSHPFPTTSTALPNPSTTVDLEFTGVIGDSCTLNVVDGSLQCGESTSLPQVALPSDKAVADTPPTVAYLDATMTVPVNARYITFDYRFTNIGDGDYVYLMVDDRPIWKMSGDAVTANEWNESGPITIAMDPGENTFVVALYGVGAQNAQFEAKNFQFIEVLPTFKDVPPAHTAYESVETLVDDSVVESCNTDNDLFCPDQALTRDTLAQWLMKALKGESYTPDPAAGTLFNDVKATDSFADWIEAFANEGITEGCDINLYCPQDLVDKAQLAKLLLVTINGTSYTPDPATGTLFDDIGLTSFNADWIEDAAKKGLLEGCAYKQFCSGEIIGRNALARILENAT